MANTILVKTDNQTPLGQDASNPLFTASGTGGSTAPVVPGAPTATSSTLVAAQYLTTRPTLTNLQQGPMNFDTRANLAVSLFSTDSTVGAQIAAPNADALSNGNSNAGLATRSIGYAYNGASFDRIRGDANAQAVQPALTTAFWSYAAATLGIVNTTTAVTIKTAAGASIRNYIQSITIDWDTLGAATEFVIRDGAGGTVLYRTKLPTAAGQKMIKFGTPLRGTANTLMEVATLTASVTGGVWVNAQGWTGA